jgi:hypothetical protein
MAKVPASQTPMIVKVRNLSMSSCHPCPEWEPTGTISPRPA